MKIGGCSRTSLSDAGHSDQTGFEGEQRRPYSSAVDNEIATQNLAKMAEQLPVQVEKISNDSLYEVQLSDPNAGNEAHAAEHTALPEQATDTVAPSGASYVVALNSDFYRQRRRRIGLNADEAFSLTEQGKFARQSALLQCRRVADDGRFSRIGRPQSAGGRRRRGADVRHLRRILRREGQLAWVLSRTCTALLRSCAPPRPYRHDRPQTLRHRRVSDVSGRGAVEAIVLDADRECRLIPMPEQISAGCGLVPQTHLDELNAVRLLLSEQAISNDGRYEVRFENRIKTVEEWHD